DNVANIHQAQADAATHGGGDARVDQIQLDGIDLRLVGAHRSFELSGLRSLRIELLFGNYALFEQGLKSLQIKIGILERSLIFEQVGLHLAQLHLIRPWIDYRQQIASLDLLAFLKCYLNKLAINAALDGNG